MTTIAGCCKPVPGDEVVGYISVGRGVTVHRKHCKELQRLMEIHGDRVVDVTGEGLDLAFHLGPLSDSDLKIRVIADCPRILCAAPSYVARRGMPADGQALVDQAHDCLNLRFPGAKEFQWTLQTQAGPRRFEIRGPFETDDGDVLTGWALDGAGIVLKPIFEVAEHLRSGALVPVAPQTPPLPTQLASLTPSRKLRDPKVQLFSDFITAHCKEALAAVPQDFPASRSE